MASSSSSENQPKAVKSSSSTYTVLTRSKSKNLSVCRSADSWWDKLPDEALILVYGYLEDHDRASMSSVCKHWNSIFKTPTLWRERHFIFVGMRALDHTKKACEFITNVGPHLRRLVLECGHPVLHTARPIAEAVSTFLGHTIKIPQMRISHFKVVYLDCYHSWRFFDLSRGKLIDALSKFIRKQRTLRKLDLSGAHLTSAEGMRCLSSAAQSPARKTIHYLHIKDLFELRYPAFQDNRFRDNLARFTSLRQLYLNYLYVDELVLQVLRTNSRTSLQYFRIVVDSCEPCNHSISAYAWRDFCDGCPYAKVVFHFLGKLSTEDYRRVFARCVPIYEIDILSWDRYPSDRDPNSEDMSAVLAHIISTYSAQLVNFRLAFDHLSNEPIDSALVMLLDRCTKLKDVCINTAIRIDTVEKICATLKKKRPRVLEHLELKVRDLTPEEVARLRGIAVLSSEELGLRSVEVQPDD
ncbi:F-box only protein 39-like [Haliotis cracherodii]|uniref:F-box only protein 39-like n=1 Tax=Haliotis cracherodii TaxID=6455 RepID=UPI0039ED8065